mmetsp:Transcript_83995/g.222453  ORF Transcript_83995/g.222453 Transcript_83995/m.222453 type:complete len:94 (-) Transcript_83995:91-372(-)
MLDSCTDVSSLAPMRRWRADRRVVAPSALAAAGRHIRITPAPGFALFSAPKLDAEEEEEEEEKEEEEEEECPARGMRARWSPPEPAHCPAQRP